MINEDMTNYDEEGTVYFRYIKYYIAIVTARNKYFCLM